MGPAFRADGDAGLLDRSSARSASTTARARTGWRRSRRCGACALPARRSPRCSGCRDDVSGILTRIGWASSAAGTGAASPTSASGRASSSTSTSRSSAASRAARAGGCATASGTTTAPSPTETASGAGRSAGNTSTSRSTTRPAWPTSRCSPTSAPRPRSPSSVALFASTVATRSGSSAFSRITGRPTARRPRARRASRQARAHGHGRNGRGASRGGGRGKGGRKGGGEKRKEGKGGEGELGLPGADWRQRLSFSATAARISSLSASSSIASPSWMSMARLVLPSRLELKRPEGSSSDAPLAKVIFTTFL